MAKKKPARDVEKAGPSTLLEAVQYFADPDVAHHFVARLRWPNEARCPRCAEARTSFLRSRRVWKCLNCKKQFSVKVGTIFEDSPLSLSKWLPAMWQLSNCKNGISSYELARAIGVTQKTAWFMLARIRLAMQQKSFNKINGQIEVDESFIGGKARHQTRYKSYKPLKGRATGKAGKTVVMGLLDRNTGKGSQIRTVVLKGTKKPEIQQAVRSNVEQGSELFTDALMSYRGLGTEYVHSFVDHAEAYVDGNVHTNGLENFWSLLKRALRGTYVGVEPFHLFRYLDEQVFRFNNRKIDDAGRFLLAAASIFGCRITYKELIGESIAAI